MHPLVKKIRRQIKSGVQTKKHKVCHCHGTAKHRKLGWKLRLQEVEQKRKDALLKLRRLQEARASKPKPPKARITDPCPDCGTQRESDMWCPKCQNFMYDY